MITLQTQPTPVTCVQACIAMCLGVPVQDVVSRFGGAAMNQSKLLSALDQCGVFFNPFMFGTLVADGYYFAVVPSLNHRGGFHQVLFEWRLGKLRVFDPAMGVRYSEDGSDMISWSDLVFFHPGGRLP